MSENESILPDCDELFQQFIIPWYTEDDLQQIVIQNESGPMVRPDLNKLTEYKGLSGVELSSLNQETQLKLIHQYEVNMFNAGVEDFCEMFGLDNNQVDLNWLDQVDKFLNEEKILEIIEGSDPESSSNTYLLTCIELGAIIAVVMKSLNPELEWIAEFPYWESALWHPKTGSIIPTTHWAIKKLSSYGWEDGLAAKITATMSMLAKKKK